jgi:RimJ/RimL family protein N-acetyltransferase
VSARGANSRAGSSYDRGMTELRTPRLLLREWREADLEPFAALNADPRVMEFFPAVLTRAQSDRFVRARILPQFAERGYGLWAVEVPGVTPFAGFVGLLEQTFPAAFTPCVEVGWRLDAPYWGHGYATEGARAALSYGFGVAGLEEIVSMTALTNTRSIAVMERLGMRRAGEFEHPNVPAGHPCGPTSSTGCRTKKSRLGGRLLNEGPAATYSPRPFQAKYHRRGGA